MNAPQPTFRHSVQTKAGRLERALAILADPQGTVNQKVAFLHSKGMPGDEITEALNQAGQGALVAATGL